MPLYIRFESAFNKSVHMRLNELFADTVYTSLENVYTSALRLRTENKIAIILMLQYSVYIKYTLFMLITI